jgi:hypothetical protein
MDLVLATVAAVIATEFAIDLWLGHRRRPRRHAATWSLAMAMYALATWALVVGLANGWSDTSFRVFYLLGAIVNIPLLALGSLMLTSSETVARRATVAVIAFLGIATWITMAAPTVGEVPGIGIPEGSEVFASGMIEIDGAPLPSPRVFAAVAGGVGTVVIVSLALRSMVRHRESNRRIVWGSALIVLGTLAPATGGSLTALGEGGGFAVSLLIGAVLLWAGYRTASGARIESAATDTMPA